MVIIHIGKRLQRLQGHLPKVTESFDQIQGSILQNAQLFN